MRKHCLSTRHCNQLAIYSRPKNQPTNLSTNQLPTNQLKNKTDQTANESTELPTDLSFLSLSLHVCVYFDTTLQYFFEWYLFSHFRTIMEVWL